MAISQSLFVSRTFCYIATNCTMASKYTLDIAISDDAKLLNTHRNDCASCRSPHPFDFCHSLTVSRKPAMSVNKSATCCAPACKISCPSIISKLCPKDATSCQSAATKLLYGCKSCQKRLKNFSTVTTCVCSA